MANPFTVQSWMSTKVVPLAPDMDVIEAIRILVEKRLSGAPVVDKRGNLLGMLSERDCMKVGLSAGYHGEWAGRVEEYMHPDVVTVDAETSILDVARMFIEGRFRRYPVIKGDRLVGVISRRDVLKALSAARDD